MEHKIKKLLRKQVIDSCCVSFHQHLNKNCEQHGFDCPDNTVKFYSSFSGKPGFGIPHPDGLSYLTIAFCPWCGKSLEEYAKNAYDGHEMKEI